MFWDINVQCNVCITTRGPDIIIIDKKHWKGIIIDIAILADVRVGQKEMEIFEKYQKEYAWKSICNY